MNNNTFIHKYIKPLLNKNDNVVDMTLGNGNDTYFLSPLVNKVIAFDIDEKAINISKERCQKFNNIVYINDNHNNIDKYINEEISLFIFNLGYLPNSEIRFITNKDDTLIAYQKAYDLLKDKGYIIITFYLGHKGGKDEYYLLDKYIQKKRHLVLTKYLNYNHIDESITYIIQK